MRAEIFALLFTPLRQRGARFFDSHPAVARDFPGLLQETVRLLDQFFGGESFPGHDKSVAWGTVAVKAVRRREVEAETLLTGGLL
jgi:hypothetical protein